jgi:hypothetical protein
MADKYVVFTEPLGKRVKTAVESAEKMDAPIPSKNEARILSGYTSPVEITGSWVQDGGTWKCRAKRLWRVEGVYRVRENDADFELYHPVSAEMPEQGIGDRVFAVSRGVWELVSGAAVGGIRR